ncbi:ATP-dependent DNA helicase RecG [Candidatus Acetothermia bacterium]|nr:ATP-dependent DNA helicase RecG [Candidatus Acetothermia bacterium]MBI3643741.1 ATP-dependent DNA helicase RecG [Candidatus Acetothermia bacterium]
MNLSKQAIERIQKILQLEKKTGYKNTAVIGGLQGFLEQALAGEPGEAREIVAGLDNYESMSAPQRRKAIEEAEDRLITVGVGEDVEPVVAGTYEASSAKTKSQNVTLESPVRFAKGVGEQRAKQFQKLEIKTISDLLMYLPRRIEDRSLIKKISQAHAGESVTVQGRIRALDILRPRPNLEILKVAVQDNTGVIFATWFNQPWLKTQFAQGERISLYGPIERNYGGAQMSNPVWEPADTNFLTGRLVPIYPVTKGLTPAILYRLIRENLQLYRDQILEILPDEIRNRQHLLPRSEALYKIHFPGSIAEFEQARMTLAFEELLLFQVGVVLQRRGMAERRAALLSAPEVKMEDFSAHLPFRLTKAQERVISEISRDLASGHPMNRLLQGDVGSGKTIVAAAAAFIASVSGAQTALMAPTEILAQQHFRRLQETLAPLKLRLALLVGSMKPKERDKIQELIAAGEIDLIVGTHALISESVEFQNLQLAIIDEQQRFGVIQRAQLEEKGKSAHVLVMSATPIPRTITLTLYGQFEISILDELPFKKEIRTYWVSEERREVVYPLIARELKSGVQAYVVYPLIEESEELDLRAATQMKEELESTFFKEFRVGLLHGRMSDDEKRSVMEEVVKKKIDVLVSTSIIEVGIDVPDASLMVIEHADRFGLSQLHQLRGRIGRQGQKSLCFAVATAKTDEGKERMEAFRDCTDGFDIAEKDLLIRGPGDLLGVAQHGLESSFKVADLIRDLELMKSAREEANALLAKDPQSSLIQEFERRFGERFDLARV